jgi:hypothetical protein
LKLGHNGNAESLGEVPPRAERHQALRIAGLAMRRKQSVDFTGYWQRRKAA